MSKYIVTLNGKKYEVEVEEVGGAPAAPVAKPQEVSAKSEAVNNEAKKEAAAAVKPVAGKTSIKAPMPGTILDVRVKKGQSIKKGDVLFILEAMKMENEIMAGDVGTVVDVVVTKGMVVNTDDVLAVVD
jgi:biotin carboxyl carrier protein